MNPYNLAVLLFSYCTFLISLLILFKRYDLIGKTFFVFCFFVTIWGFGFALLVSNDISDSAALLTAKILNSVAIFIPPSWLHFVFVYLDLDQRQKVLIQFVYFFSLILFCFAFSSHYVKGVIPAWGFNHFTNVGFLYHFFTLEFFIVVTYGFYKLFHHLKFQSGTRRSQAVAFILATLFGFIGGSLTFFPVYGIESPKYGLFLMPFYPFIMAYAIMKQGFMDSQEVLALHRDKLALLGLMSSSINHEIKNPLFITQELTKKAESKLKESNTDGEVLASIEKANGQLIRIRKIIDRLTEFGRPDIYPGIRENVYLKNVIDNALFFASQEFKYLLVEVKIEVEKRAEIIQGSRSQFEQILLNLIMNAFYAMPNGGTLKIEGRVIAKQTPLSPSPLIGEGRLGMVEITISDTGTGIPKSELKNIFKPFYTTKEKTGTGLGLHIVKTLVEQNSGKISVESEVGKGTKFKIYF